VTAHAVGDRVEVMLLVDAHRVLVAIADAPNVGRGAGDEPHPATSATV
jgi:hypothetical protein